MKRARNLSPGLQRELKALDALPDERIDTSDIPEIADQDWAKRQPFYRPIKRSVTIRVDAEVLEWFRAKGRGYQTTMNRALREYFASHR